MEERIIVLAPFGRDGVVICQTLQAAAIPCEIVDALDTLIARIRIGAGAALVTEESLDPKGTTELLAILADQPSWSDLPIVLLLASDGDRGAMGSPPEVAAIAAAGNVTALQRPLPAVTLVTAIRAALRARHHQYEVRDLLTRERIAREHAELLDQSTSVLHASLNYHETLEQIARLAVPALADLCAVDLVEPTGGLRRVGAAAADPAKLARIREWGPGYAPDRDSPVGVRRVVRTGDAVCIAEISDDILASVARDEGHLQGLRELGVVSVIVAPIRARDRTLGAITLATSIESRRRYQTSDLDLAKELGYRAGMAVDNARLYQASQQALREREEALRSREDILAIVSHDLRGPLATIALSAGSLLEEPDLAARTLQRLEIIQRAGTRMEHMINDLLDMASIDAKGLTLDRSTEDADEIITRVLEAHEGMAATKNIQLRREGELSSVELWCDRERVEQVFGNLIGNALKYGRPGDVITIGGHVVGGDVHLTIADTGPGIPADDLPHVFERYWTAKRQGTKGTGLGLYICKGIVEAHGGKIWVESTVGVGTTFSFTLPRASAAEAREVSELGGLPTPGAS